MKNFKSILSMLIVVMMVATMIVPSFANEAVEVTEAAEAYITSDGATIKVHNLFDIKDVSLAEGEYSTYREVKNNLMVSVTSKSNKVVDNTFTYVVTRGGMHTVAIRYNDGTQAVLTHEIVVTDPVFTSNGLQIIVSNLGDDVKTIRTSKGTLNSVQEIKKTEGSRSFSQNHIKYAESFLLQYREEGPVTVVVDYVHGYKVFYHYDVTKTVPTVAYGDDFVKFGNLDNLTMIRYAAGVYSSSSEIKATGVSKVLKSDAIDENGYITIADLPVNTYTFCVQYNDDSYNIYVVDITVKQWTITFDTDGGTMDAGFKSVYGVNYGDYYVDVFGGAYPTASMEGYDFTGWYLEQYNFTLTEGDVLNGGYYALNASCTLVALWEEKAPELGAYENPYLINVGDNRVVVYVPAGADAYVKANDSNGTVLTVGYATTPDYMINYARQTFYADTESGNNDTVFTMVDGLDTFCVTNTGAEDVVLYMALAAGEAADTTGTWDNPEILELTEQFGALRAWSAADLAAGNQGRWYKVTAPADGKLAINVSASDADYNSVGWQFNYTIGYAQSDNYTSIDYEYETIFADVKAGDEVVIFAATLDPNDVWNNPAATLNMNVGFVEYGAVDAPITIEAGTQLTTVKEGSYGMYYTYTAPAAGTVDVIMYSENWVYVVNNLTSYVYNDTYYSDMDPQTPCTTVSVEAGDELQIMVNTYDPADSWNAPAGSVSWELVFTAGSSVEPDEPVLGSYDNPYMLYADSGVLGVYVPAGGEAYVFVDDDNNSNVTVGYSTGNTWTIYYGKMTVITPAEDGTAAFTMVPGGNYFCIVNSGDADVTLKMILEAGAASDTTGTMDDPKVLELTETMWGAVQAFDEVTLEAGNSGYWYTVTAPADGKLFVSVGAYDEEYNNIGWFFNVNNLTAGKYGDNHYSDDAEPVYSEEVAVSAGDEVQIFVATYDPSNIWTNPAGIVSVQVSFDAIGSSNAPIELTAGAQSTTVNEASQGMYYTYTAPSAGTVDVIMYSENWQYVVNNTTSGIYGDYLTSADEEVVPCTTVAVAEGDVVTVMVNTFDPANEWTAPAGTVSWELCFTAGEVVEPEEPELGSYENPYIVNVGDMRVGAYIPAGATVYVKASDSNGSIFTLGYATAPTYEIWYLRQQYTANTESGNNDTSFTMIADVDTFGITNTGEEDINVYMALEAGTPVDTTGTWSDPEVITEDGLYTATLAANTDGYFYTYKATATGTVTVCMTAADGWFYNVNNVTGGIYGDYHYCEDGVMYETVAVSAGDEVQIVMNTYDGSWSAPAGEIVWSFNFTEEGKTWTITLDADGGVLNAPATYTCNTGDTYMDIFGGYYPVPTLEGYEFGGWYLEMYNFTLTEGDVQSGYYAVAHDCTLVALWVEA